MFSEDIIYFLSMYDVLSQRHTKIRTVCGWRRERKERERGGLLTWLEWLFLLLRYYLWRGAEGRAAASHNSTHIRGKKWPHQETPSAVHFVTNNNKTRTPDLIVFGKSMPKEEGGRLFLYRQVTMKVCHQVKPSAQTEDLEDLVTHVATSGVFFIIQITQSLLEKATRRNKSNKLQKRSHLKWITKTLR